jgi:hypothetical protein
MKYYIARRVSDPAIVGAGPQLTYATDDRNVSALDELDAVFKANWAAGTTSAQSKRIESIRARVADEAMLTSFAYTTRALWNCPFAVTDQVKEMFGGLSLTPFIFHPVAIENSNVRYSLFHCPTLLNDAIVFPNSLFFNGSPISAAPRNYHDIEDNEAYLAFISRRGGALLKPEYIEAIPNLVGVYDILAFRFGATLFSERLVGIVKDLKLSGLNFFEASDDVHPNRLYLNPRTR